MYKLVILDLDGTLLTSEKKISDYTCDVIRSIKNNIKIVLASARAFTTIKPYLEKLDLINHDNITIAFNGSLVLDNLENILINEEIGTDEKNIIQKYIDINNNTSWFYYTYEDRIKRDDIDNILDFLNKNSIYKIVCVSDEETINSMRNNLPQIIINSFQITSSEPTRIEFVKKGMTKLEAIKYILNKYNIKSTEVIAIGDGENDIDMLKFAGCGVAMGNASDEVKRAADIETDTNDNDGVGKILNNLLKL